MTDPDAGLRHRIAALRERIERYHQGLARLLRKVDDQRVMVDTQGRRLDVALASGAAAAARAAATLRAERDGRR